MSCRAVVALLLLVVVGCGTSPTVRDDPVTELVPLSVGAEWTYSRADSGEGRLAALDSVNTMRVLRDTLALGIRWYLIEGNEIFPSGSPSWFANTSSGLRRFFPAGTGLMWDFYRHPPVLGSVYLTANAQIRAFVSDTTINVPAGTFRCDGYEWLGSRQDGTLHPYRKQYVCPGVGLAKDVSDRLIYPGGEVRGWRISVLTSFRP